MPQFFFDVCAADILIVDEVGEDMEHADDAHAFALNMLPVVQLSSNSVAAGDLVDITVRNHIGQVVSIATLTLSHRRYDQMTDGEIEDGETALLAILAKPACPVTESVAASAPAKTAELTRRSQALIATAATLRKDTLGSIHDLAQNMAKARRIADTALPSLW